MNPAAVGSFLVAMGAALSAGGPQVPDAAPPEVYGPFGVVGRVSVRTEVPRAPVARLVNAGLAAAEDGTWLRWKLVWRDARVTGLEELEAADAAGAAAAGWAVPTTRSTIDMPADVPGEADCRLIGVGVTRRGRLGAWNCASADGTLLGGLGAGGRPQVQARLPQRYQAMSTEGTVHGGSRVILVAYDVGAHRFDWLELAIGG